MMKNTREMWEMISKLEELATNAESAEEEEARYRQIDTILWVMGDTSGKAVTDEWTL